MDIIIQLIGYLGVAGFILSGIQKTRKRIVLCSIIGRVSFVIHYILLGGFSGAVQNGIGGIASFISSKRGKAPFNSKYMPIFIIGLTIIGGIFTFDPSRPFVSVLPTIAMIFQNTAIWLKKGRDIRIWSLVGLPFWVTYNILSNSIPAITSDTLTAISLITGLIKHDILPAIKDKKTEP